MPDVPKTNDEPKFSKNDVPATVKAIYSGGKFLDSTFDIPGEQLGIVLDQTSFYAEQGGQEYDTGRIVIDGEAELDVQNVQVYAGYVMHTG